jgi:hypothetical protein
MGNVLLFPKFLQHFLIIKGSRVYFDVGIFKILKRTAQLSELRPKRGSSDDELI